MSTKYKIMLGKKEKTTIKRVGTIIFYSNAAHATNVLRARDSERERAANGSPPKNINQNNIKPAMIDH